MGYFTTLNVLVVIVYLLELMLPLRLSGFAVFKAPVVIVLLLAECLRGAPRADSRLGRRAERG